LIENDSKVTFLSLAKAIIIKFIVICLFLTCIYFFKFIKILLSQFINDYSNVWFMKLNQFALGKMSIVSSLFYNKVNKINEITFITKTLRNIKQKNARRVNYLVLNIQRWTLSQT